MDNMKLTWCNKRSDCYLLIHVVRYRNEATDVIKFKGSFCNRVDGYVYETKNYKMSLTRFRQLELLKD